MTSKFNKVLAVSMLTLVALASVAFSVTPMEAHAEKDRPAPTLMQRDGV